jgi:hypothetical protein
MGLKAGVRQRDKGMQNNWVESHLTFARGAEVPGSFSGREGGISPCPQVTSIPQGEIYKE